MTGACDDGSGGKRWHSVVGDRNSPSHLNPTISKGDERKPNPNRTIVHVMIYILFMIVMTGTREQAEGQPEESTSVLVISPS